MEFLLGLLGLVVLAIPVFVVVLLVGHVRLRRRVEQLERQITELGGTADTMVQAPTLKDMSTPVETEVTEEKPKPAPWPAPRPQAAAASTPDDIAAQSAKETSAAVVFRKELISGLFVWMRENWFYAVSALSLALAGIFLVQYGVESGLLSPTARVAAALIFGALLIAVGEVVRRRFGDDEDSPTAYLPSVFSGAGLVSLFGGILAARQLYDLISPETALAGMMLVALVGLVLGWFHGPLLAAVGLIGAFAAPFVVGGSSDNPSWLYGYFFVISVLGLGIDTVRRWAWISVLTLIGAYAAAWLLVLGSPLTEPTHLCFAAALAVITVLIPNRRIWPDHTGPMISDIFFRKTGDPWPDFPTRLAFASVAVTTAILSLFWAASTAEFWLGVTLLGGLILALILWAKDAPALQDITILPAAGLIGFVLLHGLDHGPARTLFDATYLETAEADYPWVVTLLVAFGAMVSVLSAWRSLAERYAVAWAAAAALFAPLLAIAVEVGWQPSNVIGAYYWALHAVALGTLMVAMAERFARVDAEDRMRTSLATLSALSCLTFACVIVLSSAALTVAIVAAIVVAAALDRKFTLPPMSWFIWTGVVTVGVRLVLEPGIYWAAQAPVPEMTIVYSASIVGFVLAHHLLKPLSRPVAALMLESAAWATGGVLLSLLLLRWLESFGEFGATDSHWGLGLLSVIWLSLAFAQVQRLELGGKLQVFRILLGIAFALHGLLMLGEALTDANPLLRSSADPVLGPPVFNTLAIAYLFPALAIGFSAWRISSMPKLLQQASYAAAVALGALWLGLAIRHFWQGAAGMYQGNGVTQPELYTYTLTLLAIGAILFYQSLARRSDVMRKAGLLVIGLAVAKVFLIDIAGLGGLIRVFSLLALGLALAGLAWLNRWAQLRHSPQEPEPLDQ
ncbi:MAG: DUF2339 domain-containing protein [Ruegeria sp.]